MNFFTRLFFSVFLLSIFNISIFGYLGTTGKIAGRITDAGTGEALPFVNVIIEGTTMGAATDIDGYYNILNISPGTYSVKASAIGFNSVTYQNIRVSIDLTTELNFELSVESLELGQDVVVIAKKPLIQQDLTATTAIIGDDLIQELPVTDIGEVLSLQAGIVVSPGGDIHVRGGRSGQIAYQIDGVPVTDAYDGGTVVDVNTSAVQELQVISGAFNAEYGQALSGVVNLVTKNGGNEFKGSVQSYIGDYVSSKTDIFWNIDDIDPVAIRNFEGSISGPIIRDKLFFFANGRYLYNTGQFFGRREFLVTDRAAEVPGSGGAEYFISKNGDSAWVPMNSNERIYGQGKITYNLFPGFRTTYNYMIERRDYQLFNGGSRLTPDNNLDRFEKSVTNIFSINHAISAKSFYTLNLSYFFNSYRHYLFENISTGDPANPSQYVDNTVLQTPPYSFSIGGTDYSRFERSSGSYVAKLDWTTQITQQINVQFGGEFKRHELSYHNINLVSKLDENGQKLFPFEVTIPSLATTDNDMYKRNPMEGAAYVQAKFEIYDIIFNAGVRFDAFEPDGVILNDPSDPNINDPLKPDNQFNDLNGNGDFDPAQGETLKTTADRAKYWYTDASVKTQLSPRVGLAFPISDRGVIHFSYGHFFQLPRYELLYTNPDFEIGVGSGNQGIFGNADLFPQKTVKGEIGLQQQLSDNIAVDVTMFFEDFRNLTGTQADEIEVFGRDRTYSRYANSDFGFSKGVIFKFTQRFAEGLSSKSGLHLFSYKRKCFRSPGCPECDCRRSFAGNFYSPVKLGSVAHTEFIFSLYTAG